MSERKEAITPKDFGAVPKPKFKRGDRVFKKDGRYGGPGVVVGALGSLKVVVSSDVPKGEIRINPESLGILFTVSDA